MTWRDLLKSCGLTPEAEVSPTQEPTPQPTSEHTPLPQTQTPPPEPQQVSDGSQTQTESERYTEYTSQIEQLQKRIKELEDANKLLITGTPVTKHLSPEEQIAALLGVQKGEL